ncbi:uncharacterized protein F5147DRAFT_613129 [Suillus discolor]|uniref:polynucleotide adenylyltransferase n=1 Tax=Suillus discolor TaxID=1912936 RepID=A0A9P7JTA2_9AGAM|nr:uncharacterized protein F5147DRAFT_613129 [Suillus discolor]KAG2107627.1 hypothetical protein F5147DRAFT_613129 [Suillus discolor]
MAQSSSSVQSSPYSSQRRHASKHRFFVVELSQALFDFVIRLLPAQEEMAVKEDVRKLLERLIRTIEPDSRLLSFGSTANGFSLRNSDMDLCCLIDSAERLSASDMVTMLGDLLERETKFHVKPLPHARIPIVKLSLDPSPGLPHGIACDIGFENRLALENTRLLMCYAMIDPTRVRTLVLFLKVWSKRRNINSPYQGTLSSYGYVLLVIYFLIHVKNPPVLPNLQQMPPLRPISQEDTHIGGHNTWFFDDIELLRQRWQSSNTDSVADLLIDFFRYYSRDFTYNTGVASIRGGLLKKDSKGWQNELAAGRYNDSRERNRFCIEDPFEIDFNVARCVTKEGLYQIRGEFMRASRILAMRPRASVALAQLCEEKGEDPQTTSPPSVFVPPRLSIPPQTPYTVGSNSMRPKGASAERLSPQPEFFEPENRHSGDNCVPSRTPPEHMAPKRTQWTSPPPPEAPPAHHAIFEDQLDQGLALATSSTMAREAGKPTSSPEHFDLLSDEERRSDATESDEVQSVQSFTEGSRATPLASTSFTEPVTSVVGPSIRGRVPSRSSRPSDKNVVPPNEATLIAYKAELIRRSHSGPPNGKSNRFSWPSATSIAYTPTFGPSISTSQSSRLHVPDTSASINTVFYETTGTQPRFPTYPAPAPSHLSSNVPFYMRNYLDQTINNTATIDISRDVPPSSISQAPFTHSHSHTHSTTTITSRVQLIPRHPPGSPPHSPLRNSMHGRIGMVCGHGSDSSSPTSGSCSPSPSPTLLHQQHAVDDFSRYNTFKMVAPRLRRIRADPATVDLTPDVALR